MTEIARNHAVVLSGGGSNGAYEVGVLRGLLNGESPSTDYKPIEVAIYTGTSVGAYNAAIMASQPGATDGQSALYLEKLWRRRVAHTPGGCGNGILRVRTGPLELFNLDCLERQPLRTLLDVLTDTLAMTRHALERGLDFAGSSLPLGIRLANFIDLSALISVDPFHLLLQETLDIDRLRASAKSLYVAVSNWTIGTITIYDKRSIVDRLRGRAILASAAIPSLFPPVPIEGTLGVDGGLLINTPLQPALQAGAEVLHVIYIDPRLEHMQLHSLLSTATTMYRTFVMLSTAQIRNDLALIRAVSQGTFQGRLATLRQRFKHLVVHVYRPSSFRGGGGPLDFSLKRVDRLIELGYRNALGHNCEENGCWVGGREV